MNKLQIISDIDKIQEKKDHITWLSVYIFYNGNLDEVLCKLVKPFINKVLDKYVEHYFFIRYFEDGPHIRLRLKGDSLKLNNSALPLLENMANDFFSNSSRQNYSAYLKVVPYMPEYERYGGEVGVELAEELFQLSSKVILSIMDNKDWNYQKAIGAALQLHIIFVYAFFENKNELCSFLDFGRDNRVYFAYLTEKTDHKNIIDTTTLIRELERSYVKQKNKINAVLDKILIKLKDNAAFEDIFIKDWNDNVKIIAKKFQSEENLITTIFSNVYDSNIKSKYPGISKWGILDSYIHMTNNRLGLWCKDEMYVYYILREYFACCEFFK